MSSEEMLNYRIKAYGSSPPLSWLRPDMINPLTGTLSLSLRAGAEWGTCTPPTVDNYSVFLKKQDFPMKMDLLPLGRQSYA